MNSCVFVVWHAFYKQNTDKKKKKTIRDVKVQTMKTEIANEKNEYIVDDA